ncbi:hypothetical protein EW145_g459 [Phellinidium pouzarii]|uniref:SET domain-containing protein n=1 Tax=Phellinidium pouzarii TaxID=167371 RepID=A0A4S4LNR4_9AGAM|nr:hypothetical protein EW145_g459 [Phellinidium pouzarii]
MTLLSAKNSVGTQKKKVEQHVAETKGKEAAQGSSPLGIPRELLLAIYEKSKEEPVPASTDERHQFFASVISTAERLALEGPQNYLEAAVYFYQALRVYPSPMELIGIYQKTVPEPVLIIVMELYNIEVLGRIHGYFDNFPAKSMNVSVKQHDPKNSSAGQMRTYSLVSTRSFKSGDEIYKESPVVAVLNADVQAAGTNCSFCFREVEKDSGISPASDRLGSVYCSEKCQRQCDVQSQDLLFNDKNPLPVEFAIDIPQSAKEARPKTQDAFIDYWRKSGSSGLLLVARLVAMQIISELAKALPQAASMKAELPEMIVSSEYTVYDRMERLRFVDVAIPENEHKTLQDLIMSTLPFLEDVHTDERHAAFRRKIAYNAIGVYLGENKDVVPALTETTERTRTPYGTGKQIGSGLYFVSSYLGHSCCPSVRPSFIGGTSELHLFATRDIEEGEELTMSYVDSTQHAEETPVGARMRRRAELLRGWKFSCACAKCEEEEKLLHLEKEGGHADGSRIEPALERHLADRMKSASQTSLEDAFIKVSFEEEPSGPRSAAGRDGDSKGFTGWVDKASAQFARPNIIGADLLRKLYPKHSLVMSQDYNLNILGYPGAVSIPIKPDEVITNSVFQPVGRGTAGMLLSSVEFGCFMTAWDKYEFTIYIVRYIEGLGSYSQHFILHEGSDTPSRGLLSAAGAWSFELHDEIWVFNQGFWSKNHALWKDVQKAKWEDVILKDSFKKALQNDVYSFYDSEDLYKGLGIAWKRGLILYGPPGNGKTISLKAIMKTVQEKGYNPLYVRSFQSWMGEEAAMQEVFGKARILAPCVLILEDLDSLINNSNRSFFLNQLDGIEDNDGLLLIATTNHFDSLDPGLSTRPSRFDRKYIFDDPDRDERLQYARYWQNKLSKNVKVEFPDSLAEEVADLTHGFSFAYLKECFVSTLVLLVADTNETPFEVLLKSQIKELRKQLNKSPPSVSLGTSRRIQSGSEGRPPLPPKPDMWEAARSTMAQTMASLSRPGHAFVY